MGQKTLSFEFCRLQYLASKMLVPCGEATLAEAVAHGTEYCSLFKPSWLPSWLTANQLTMGVRKVLPIASALLALFSGASSQTTGRKFRNFLLIIFIDVESLFALHSRPKEVSQSSFGYGEGLRLVARSGETFKRVTAVMESNLDVES